MREIRFRAWDKERRIIDFFIYPNGAVYEVNKERGMNLREEDWRRDCVLEQFTGLKDKNGREIYEGDIVQAVGQPKSRGVIEWTRSEVGGFDVMRLRHYENPDFSNGSVGVEVIGNIHENPELFKK